MAGEWMLKDDWDEIEELGKVSARLEAEIARLRAEKARLRERADRAEAALRPFAVFLAWIEAAVEVGDLDPITDQSCVTSIHPGGGSHYLWVGDFRRAQEAILGLDAPPAGEGGVP